MEGFPEVGILSREMERLMVYLTTRINKHPFSKDQIKNFVTLIFKFSNS